MPPAEEKNAMSIFFVGSGQTLSGVTLGSGDDEYVLLGGTATGTIVNGGFLDNGGTTTGTTINSGVQIVEPGGAATSTTINGGYQDDNGIASGTTINWRRPSYRPRRHGDQHDNQRRYAVRIFRHRERYDDL
jgi:autotransporter passenger strand-loop-strand repeat protein